MVGHSYSLCYCTVPAYTWGERERKRERVAVLSRDSKWVLLKCVIHIIAVLVYSVTMVGVYTLPFIRSPPFNYIADRGSIPGRG
jgi:hypothetical protein